MRWPTNITLCHNRNTISIEFLHGVKPLQERRMIVQLGPKDWKGGHNERALAILIE